MEITNSLSNVHVFLPLPPPRVTSGTLRWLSLLNTNKTTFKSHYCLPDQASSTRLAESCDTPFWNFPLASGQSLAQQKVPFFFSFLKQCQLKAVILQRSSKPGWDCGLALSLYFSLRGPRLSFNSQIARHHANDPICSLL